MAQSLTVNTTGGGLTTFGAAVGGSAALATLTTNADGTTALGGDLSATSIDLGDAVRLDSSVTLTGTDVRFRSTVNSLASGVSALAVNAQTTRFDGDVGAGPGGNLGALVTDAAGTTTLNAAHVRATTITFLDRLGLIGSTTLDAGNTRLREKYHVRLSETPYMVLSRATLSRERPEVVVLPGY